MVGGLEKLVSWQKEGRKEMEKDGWRELMQSVTEGRPVEYDGFFWLPSKKILHHIIRGHCLDSFAGYSALSVCKKATNIVKPTQLLYCCCSWPESSAFTFCD